MKPTKLAVALACASAAALTGAAPSMAGETAVGLTTDSPSTLLTFPVSDPGSAAPAGITFPGGATDTNLVGLDYRPRSNQVYAFGSLGTLYVLNPPAMAGGPWTAVQVSAGLGAFPAATDTGLDVNPAADAVRVVNEANQNYRFNPLNGAGGAGTMAGGRDADLNPGDPNVVAAGYTNNFDGTTSTELFDIDSGSDMLFKQNPPNAGTLEPRGMLGVDTTDNAGFDIAQGSKVAYAALERASSPGSSVLYTVNTGNGAATPAGAIGGGKLVESLSVVPASVIGFAASTSAVSEAGGAAEIAVVRSGPENRVAAVDYSVGGGGPSGTLTFAPGDAIETISVPVADNGQDGPDAALTLTLSNAGANAIVGPGGTATLTVMDDDDKPVAPMPTPLTPPAKKPTRASSSLVIGGKVIARASVRLNGGGSGRATLKLSRKSRRALLKSLGGQNGKPLSLRLRVR